MSMLLNTIRSRLFGIQAISLRTLATAAAPPSSSPAAAAAAASPSKEKKPAQRQKIVLKDEDLIETFVKGSGPGGQCINKRSSCVDLRHIPTGVRVQCQQSRSLADNRGIARKLLREKLDDLWNGSASKNAQKAAKVAKQRAKRAKRAREKYGNKKEGSAE